MPSFAMIGAASMMMSSAASRSYDDHHRIYREPGDLSGIFFILLGCFFLFIAVVIVLIVRTARSFFMKRKASRKGPLTHEPMIPFPQDNLLLFTGTYAFPNQIPMVKIQVSKEKVIKRWHDGLFGNFAAIERADESIILIFDRNCYGHSLRDTVPKNAQTVSIPMEGFKCEEKCHDFEPIDGAVEGSSYTYQMYGNNRIQVTRYVENGVSYVAGFCIYIEKPWISGDEYSKTVVEELLKQDKYPRRTEAMKSNCLPPSYDSIFVV